MFDVRVLLRKILVYGGSGWIFISEGAGGAGTAAAAVTSAAAADSKAAAAARIAASTARSSATKKLGMAWRPPRSHPPCRWASGGRCACPATGGRCGTAAHSPGRRVMICGRGRGRAAAALPPTQVQPALEPQDRASSQPPSARIGESGTRGLP